MHRLYNCTKDILLATKAEAETEKARKTPASPLPGGRRCHQHGQPLREWQVTAVPQQRPEGGRGQRK